MARVYEDTTRVGPAVDGRVCADGKPRHELQHISVQTYCGNHSAFSGYRFTPSAYSSVRCTQCGEYWRTNAGWVDLLPRHGDTLAQQHATYDRMLDERIARRADG